MARPTARQVVDAALVRIDAANGRINALILIDADSAREHADALDRTPMHPGPLAGTTFVVKDLIDVASQATRGGSRLLCGLPVTHDAACVSRLKSAGAIMLGKANMHELAVGGAVNPWFGQVLNPLSAEHGTGGTSSGSAAAVAAGFCSFSLGTDSGGSNRSVAAACGLYGYKPTNGLIASDGVLPTAPSMDTVGLIAPSAELMSTCLDVLTADEALTEGASLRGRTFGRLINLLASPMDGVVSEAWELAYGSVTEAGGRVVELEVEAPGALAKAGVAILRHEFVETYGERIDRSRDSVGPAVHAFLRASREVSRAEYEEATALRTEHRRQWARMLSDVDGFLSPTAPGLAPDLGAEMTAVGETRVPYGAAGAEFRMWANTIGIPAIAIPVRRNEGLPASIQLAGRANSDRVLMGLAAALGHAMTEKTAVPSNSTHGEKP